MHNVHTYHPRSTIKDFKLVASKWSSWEYFCHKIQPTLQLGLSPSGKEVAASTYPCKSAITQIRAIHYRAHPTKAEPLPEARDENLLANRLQLKASHCKARTTTLLVGFLRPGATWAQGPTQNMAIYSFPKQTPCHLPSSTKFPMVPKDL